MIASDLLKGVPLLVLANKQDLQNSNIRPPCRNQSDYWLDRWLFLNVYSWKAYLFLKYSIYFIISWNE